MDKNSGFTDSIVRLVAFLGLLLVLLLGAWGIILLAFNLPTIAGNVGRSIVSVFDYSPASETPAGNENPQTPTVTVKPTVTTPAQKPAATVQPTYTPAQTYVPAAAPVAKAALYGAPDLSVRILSVNSLSSVQGRTVVQFEIMNVGSNVATAGWTFDAQLPLGYAYTYNSPAQQALYPGDKIVYTLGFNNTNQNQYCTMQYPNYNCPPTPYPQPYQPAPQAYPYNSGTCYTYNGYQNIPAPCVNADGDYVYNTQNPYHNTYGYGRMITITVDPRNFVYDLNRTNNTASIASPVY